MVFICYEEDKQAVVVKKHHGNSFKIEHNVLQGCEKQFDDDRHIGQIVFDAFNKSPEHVGIIDATTGKKVKFSEMKEKSIRLAVWMRKEGIVPGDVISIFSPSHRDVYSILVATYFNGAAYNPMDYDVNTTSARSYIRTTKPKVVFAHEGKVDVIQEAAALENHECKIIVLGEKKEFESFDHILNEQSTEDIENFKVITDIDPESIGSIAFSSGTTGTPKGIPHSYEQVKVQAMTPILDEDVENDVHLCYFYPGWGIHIRYTLSFILYKTTQIFHRTFDATETCEIIERHKVSTVSMDTYKFLLMCADDFDSKCNLECVKMIIPIGSRVVLSAMPKLQKKFPKAIISKRMGLTETSELTRYTKECSNLLSEGIVGPNIQLTIKDMKTGEKLGPNQVGELCVIASQVITGYYKNPAETERVYDNEGWFHSGDEAYYDENGEIVIVGRIKEMIVYRDIVVHPSSVEDALLEHPDVSEAAVIAVPHELFIERPIAFVKTIPGSKVTKNELEKVVHNFEYSDMLEDAIEFVDKMPRNTNGKINKKILKEMAKKYYQ